MGNICIILNPTAGGVDDLDVVMAQLRRLPDAEIRLTGRRGSAARFARTALRKGREIIVAAGGGGALDESIKWVGGKLGGARGGLVSLGTGDGFSRTIGSPAEPAD